MKYQATILDLQNYISTCHSINLHIDVVHPNSTLLHMNPPPKPHHFENAFSSSFTTSPYVLPIQTRKRLGLCGLTKTKSPSLRFLNKVYAIEGLMFFGPQ
jgi:hypothetical protein